jgi:hypothetical protein
MGMQDDAAETSHASRSLSEGRGQHEAGRDLALDPRTLWNACDERNAASHHSASDLSHRDSAPRSTAIRG